MILFINGCARANSRTLELANTVLSRETDEIRELKLFPDGPEGLDPERLALRDALWAKGDFDHPLFRWAREFPRVADQRAPFTEDDNWPPAPGTDYAPPIEENNAKCGWTEQTKADNAAKAKARQDELMRLYGLA